MSYMKENPAAHSNVSQKIQTLIDAKGVLRLVNKIEKYTYSTVIT